MFKHKSYKQNKARERESKAGSIQETGLYFKSYSGNDLIQL